MAGYFATIRKGGRMTDTTQGMPTPALPWSNSRRPWDEPMPAYVEGREFSAVLKGYELRQLPNVPIVCKPLINTSTHELAIETDPRWCMKIRHVGSWRIKTRPKVRIYREDMSGWRAAPAVCFDLPSCHRFETIESAFRKLAECDFQLSPHNVNLRAIHRTAEKELREQITAEVRLEFEAKARHDAKEELRNSMPSLTDMLIADTEATRQWLAERRPKASRKAAVLSSAEVIDIRDRLRQRGLFLAEEEPSGLSATG